MTADHQSGGQETNVRVFLAERYLKGAGLEIGALHFPLQVPTTANVSYVDRMSVPDLRRHYPELASSDLVDVDIIDDGETLSTVPDGSQDFVIANHFLEHCQNPIATLTNLMRVIKVGGILFFAVPDKRYSIDFARPVTSLAHLIRDYELGPERSKYQHFAEWVRYIENQSDVDIIQQRANALIEADYSIHYHVWTHFEMMELLVFLRRNVLSFVVQQTAINEVRGEFISILRKTTD